jgi:hypothetical protein
MRLGLHEYEWTIGILRGSGPNEGWFANPKPTFTQPTIYVTRFLCPGDQYYEMQIGGGYCTKADLDTVRSEVVVHEAKHQVRANTFWQGNGGRDLEAAVDYSPGIPTGGDVSGVRRRIQHPHFTRLDSIQRAWDDEDRKLLPCVLRLQP